MTLLHEQPSNYRHHDRRGRYRRPITFDFKRASHRAIRVSLYVEADFTCQQCGYRPPNDDIPTDYDGRYTIGRLVIDHIVPLWNDGDRYGSNLQVLCSTCNGRKG